MAESSGTVVEGVKEGEAEDVEVGDDDGELELEVETLPFITVTLMSSEVSPEPGAA